MAVSKKYIWVEINRDHTPDIPKKFNVSAYPSLIVLGASQEKVFRFQSYQKPPEFLAYLDEGLTRYELYKSGKEWDEPNPRPAKLNGTAAIETRKAPSEQMAAGIAFLKGDMWVAQRGELNCIDLRSGQIKKTFKLPEFIVDIATDGKRLYLLDKGWTAGRPIFIINPKNGKEVGQIVTEANKTKKVHGAGGIAWRGKRLYVVELGAGRLHELNRKNGKILRTIQPKDTYIMGLDFDGQNFVTASRKGLNFFHPDTGEAVRKVAMNYPLQAVAYHQGAYYVMEQQVMGFDKQHQSVRIWPRETYIYKLQFPAQ